MDISLVMIAVLIVLFCRLPTRALRIEDNFKIKNENFIYLHTDLDDLTQVLKVKGDLDQLGCVCFRKTL